MNFKLDNDSLGKVYNIFELIEEKKEIGLNNCASENREEE